MILLGEVEGTPWNFVNFASSTQLGILTQLVVHSLTRMVGRSNGGITIYICYIVSTIDSFNFSYASQSIVDLFLFSSWSLNIYFSFILL